MCGRYALLSEADREEIRNFLREIEDRLKTGEAYPTDTVPVLIASNKEASDIIAGMMSWGFPNSYGSGVVINARSETISEKPMFREAIRQRRCIIPASGYYEWSGAKGNKTKHFITVPGKPLYMAGCYTDHHTASGVEQRFVIITTEANSSVSDIHDRMPLILSPDEFSGWLNADYRHYFDRSQIRLTSQIVSDNAQMSLF